MADLPVPHHMRRHAVPQPGAVAADASRHIRAPKPRRADRVMGLANGSMHREMAAAIDAKLTALQASAVAPDEHEAAQVAWSQTPRLVSVLRELLAAHEPDRHGRCRTCRGRWSHRRTAAPCRAYLSAYLCLLHTDEGAQADTDRHVPSGLPTDVAV